MWYTIYNFLVVCTPGAWLVPSRLQVTRAAGAGRDGREKGKKFCLQPLLHKTITKNAKANNWVNKLRQGKLREILIFFPNPVFINPGRYIYLWKMYFHIPSQLRANVHRCLLLCSSKNIHSPPPPPHWGYFCFKLPSPWGFHARGCLSFPSNFRLFFSTLLGTTPRLPWKNISLKDAVALYFYAKDNCFCDTSRS